VRDVKTGPANLP